MRSIKTREDGHRSIKYDHYKIIEKVRQGMKYDRYETYMSEEEIRTVSSNTEDEE